MLAGVARPVGPAGTGDAWQLRYINLDVRIDPAAQSLSGVSRLTFSASGTPGDLRVDLSDSLTLDSARVQPGGGPGRREAGGVRFTPRGGGSVVVALWYHGHPARRAVGFAPGGQRAASYGLPRSAREWWPSADDPGQKADSADLRFTAPAELTVVSNGYLVGRVASPDGRSATVHWGVRHPIYSDVVSFALADYTVTHDAVRLAGGRRTPLEFYVFPEDSAKAAVDFAPVGQILQFYESRLGPYPFGDEKYALVEFSRPSFREGQTLTHLGAVHITGRRDMEQVIAHEVAHQWFGNNLSVRRWEDIWLNESLSEFMAWQWIGHAQGDAAYQSQFDQALAMEFPLPITPANPDDFNSLFGAGPFVKGPAVLAMLQDVMGADAFRAALTRYVADHAGGTVESVDFQRAAEQAYHQPLGWFFDQWLRGTMEPRLRVTWQATGQSGAAVQVRQTQGGAPFRLPLVFRVTTAAGTGRSKPVWLTGVEQRFQLPSGARVTG